MRDHGISVIIPAYNEGARIAEVLSVVRNARSEGIVDEIIVVDDGSVDDTLACAKKYDEVRCIALPNNLGKGMAMYEGSRLARGEILLFLDADLTGLRVKHIADLINPVRQGRAEVTISLRDPSILTWIYNVFGLNPVSGERALKKNLFQKIPIGADTGFAIETKMNAFLLERNMKFLPVRTNGLKNSFKHRKNGFNGLVNDLRMYREILAANPRHLCDYMKMIVKLFRKDKQG